MIQTVPPPWRPRPGCLRPRAGSDDAWPSVTACARGQCGGALRTTPRRALDLDVRRDIERTAREQRALLDRFIPVRSTAGEIMLCCLDYLDPMTVAVHDVVYTRGESGWQIIKSSYPKLPLALDRLSNQVAQAGAGAPYAAAGSPRPTPPAPCVGAPRAVRPTPEPRDPPVDDHGGSSRTTPPSTSPEPFRRLGPNCRYTLGVGLSEPLTPSSPISTSTTRPKWSLGQSPSSGWSNASSAARIRQYAFGWACQELMNT